MNPTLVGTGLRVLSNVGNFQTENQLTTSSVYIRDNYSSKLLYEQFILLLLLMELISGLVLRTQVFCWFLQTDRKPYIILHHKQLPCLANVINDIAINSSTGGFIATDKA
jgi:hypothetical protein